MWHSDATKVSFHSYKPFIIEYLDTNQGRKLDINYKQFVNLLDRGQESLCLFLLSFSACYL